MAFRTISFMVQSIDLKVGVRLRTQRAFLRHFIHPLRATCACMYWSCVAWPTRRQPPWRAGGNTMRATCIGVALAYHRRLDTPERGCSSMVEQKLPKLTTRVRFPSPAPIHDNRSHWASAHAPEKPARGCG